MVVAVFIRVFWCVRSSTVGVVAGCRVRWRYGCGMLVDGARVWRRVLLPGSIKGQGLGAGFGYLVVVVRIVVFRRAIKEDDRRKDRIAAT